jgi:transposase
MKPTWRNVLPSTCVTFRAMVPTEDGLIIEAEGQSCGRCPSCRRTSTARHSRYWRTMKDLTAHGQSVTLRVRVSRWRCRNPQCATVIFGERLPAVAAPRTHASAGASSFISWGMRWAGAPAIAWWPA